MYDTGMLAIGGIRQGYCLNCSCSVNVQRMDHSFSCLSLAVPRMFHCRSLSKGRTLSIVMSPVASLYI